MRPSTESKDAPQRHKNWPLELASKTNKNIRHVTVKAHTFKMPKKSVFGETFKTDKNGTCYKSVVYVLIQVPVVFQNRLILSAVFHPLVRSRLHFELLQAGRELNFSTQLKSNLSKAKSTPNFRRGQLQFFGALTLHRALKNGDQQRCF